MKKIKVFIEISSYGYSAYMDDCEFGYGCIGEGKTVAEAVADFNDSYEEIKNYSLRNGEDFEEAEFEFYYDTASFLQEYAGIFSLSGLEKITGVSQKQLGHYLHGRRKPTQRTLAKIKSGIAAFAKDLTAVNFA